jgi:hypothetical protein
MKSIATAISLLGLALTPAIAQVPDRDMARCAAITESAARLVCLDALAAAAVARLNAGVAAPAAPAAPAAVVSPDAGFGKVAKPLPVPAEPDLLESEIEGYVDEWHGRSLFKLKNGQIWRVSDGSSGSVGLRNPKVRIVRNRFGTYFLEFAGLNGSPKVRRVE